MESFKFKEDQKRALVSRLMQRQCVAVALGIPWEKVLIKRTKGRKPFVINKGLDKTHAPNFNFNVSHEVRSPASRRLLCFTPSFSQTAATMWSHRQLKDEHHCAFQHIHPTSGMPS